MLLALVLTMVAAACGDSGEDTTTTPGDTTRATLPVVDAELARSGHPMGGRFSTKSESDAEAMKFNISLYSFVACFFTLSLAVVCLFKYFSQRKEKHEPVR